MTRHTPHTGSQPPEPDPDASLLDHRPRWQARAACRSENPDLFFPVGTSGAALKQIEQAKAVCRRCDVITQCLKWALQTKQEAGVWGGLSEDERRNLRRKLQRKR